MHIIVYVCVKYRHIVAIDMSVLPLESDYFRNTLKAFTELVSYSAGNVDSISYLMKAREKQSTIKTDPLSGRDSTANPGKFLYSSVDQAYVLICLIIGMIDHS